MIVKFKGQLYEIPQSGWYSTGLPKFKLRYSCDRYDEFGNLYYGVWIMNETAEGLIKFLGRLETPGGYSIPEVGRFEIGYTLHHAIVGED
jgi:hypothetical protein